MAGEEEEIKIQTEENDIIDESTVNETGDNASNDRLIKLPLTRVKNIIKSDPDVTLTSQDAVIALAKATELFIQMFAKDASGSTLQGKRKTLQRKDLDHVMDRHMKNKCMQYKTNVCSVQKITTEAILLKITNRVHHRRHEFMSAQSEDIISEKLHQLHAEKQEFASNSNMCRSRDQFYAIKG